MTKTHMRLRQQIYGELQATQGELREVKVQNQETNRELQALRVESQDQKSEIGTTSE
jgi:hypothetical protein